MDVPILRYVDVFIGLALVMLLGCSVIAAVTQLITSTFYLRAQYLRQGLADLLQQLDPSAKQTDCQYAAKLILRHPLVSRPETLPGRAMSWMGELLAPLLGSRLQSRWLPSGAPAVVLQRHELISILLEWAAGEGVLGNNNDKGLGALTARIRSVLATNGIESPSDALNAVRYQALAQERAFPERPAHMWQSAAFIDACPAALVGKIHGWHDAMSARTAQRFALQSKMIGTAVAGILLLFVFPIDSLDLLKRLSLDDKLRETLVQRAQQKMASATNENDRAAERQNVENLNSAALELRTVTAPLGVQWQWPPIVGAAGWNHFPGILLSWVLLSLGTPFWYDALKNLLKFRSVLAQKEEKDRADRLRSEDSAAGPAAVTATVAAGVVAVAAQPVIEDESGDRDQLEAVG